MREGGREGGREGERECGSASEVHLPRPESNNYVYMASNLLLA